MIIITLLLINKHRVIPKGSLKFSKKTILQLLASVMKADLTKDLKAIKHPSFRVSSSYCEKNNVSKREVVSEILSEKRLEKKEEKYQMIDCFFDFGITWSDGSKITQEQWIAILKENGIEVSIATFKRYLKDRGYSKRRKNKKVSLPKPIYNHYSIRFNDDTFDEEVEHDESLVSFGRKFAEIIERYHDSDEFRKTWRA